MRQSKQKDPGTFMILILLTVISYSCRGLSGQTAEQRDMIKALKKEDSTVFMPVVRQLAAQETQAVKNFGAAIPHLKKIITENRTTVPVKAPAIQALCVVAGDSSTFEWMSGWSWEEQFSDSGTENWKDKWTLDGWKASVANTPQGMELNAGPVAFDDSSHMVLWTRQYFHGDLKIEYNYTRLDQATRFVNILYIQATGSGEGPHSKDIAEWSDLRRVAAMNQYFGNMFIYHVSYAAFGNQEGLDKPGYIRARRYMAGPLRGTELEPDFPPDGLFATAEPHRIRVIKTNRHLFMEVENEHTRRLCHWYNNSFPGITEGYVGLRQMCTRAARYSDFIISGME